MTSLPPLPAALEVPIVDSHCHLDTAYDRERFGTAPTLAESVAAAEAVGVNRLVNVGYDVTSSEFSVAAASTHTQVLAAVALHPNEAPRFSSAATFDSAFAVIEELARHPRVRAIGETGLDYFRTPTAAGQGVQQESFRRHIELAKALNLALVIHDRDAHRDVVRLLKEQGPPDRVVFHCFSGDVDLVRSCARYGWFMSFAGPVTFKANHDLRVALLTAPEELLLIETDAPYLTPHPYRGKPNAPYLLPTTFRAIAQVRGVPESKLAFAINKNSEAVFGSW